MRALAGSQTCVRAGPRRTYERNTSASPARGTLDLCRVALAGDAQQNDAAVTTGPVRCIGTTSACVEVQTERCANSRRLRSARNGAAGVAEGLPCSPPSAPRAWARLGVSTGPVMTAVSSQSDGVHCGPAALLRRDGRESRQSDDVVAGSASSIPPAWTSSMTAPVEPVCATSRPPIARSPAARQRCPISSKPRRLQPALRATGAPFARGPHGPGDRARPARRVGPARSAAR